MSIQTDFAWFLCRLNTNSLFSTVPLSQNDGPPIPSWSAFNATISAESPLVTSTGYCPIINASTTEYSTMYEECPDGDGQPTAETQRHYF